MATDDRADAPEHLWAEQWAVQVPVKADTIEHEMRMAQRSRDPLGTRGEAVVRAIEAHLGSARKAVERRHRFGRFEGRSRGGRARP